MFYKRGIIIFISFLLILGNVILPRGVVKAISDTTPPVLNSISVDKSTVTGGDTVTITIDASDDISGINGGWINYDSPSGKVHKWLNSIRLVNGKWQSEININPNDESGQWKVVSITLSDKVNNLITINRNDILSQGDFQVTGTVSDITPPVLNSISVDKSTVTGGDTVTVTIDASDDISGINGGWINYDSPSGKVHKWLNSIRLVNGKWQSEININPNDESGQWKVVSITLSDKVNNLITINRNDTLIQGDFEVTSQNDTTPIQVTGITLDKQQISLDIGQTVSITSTINPSNAANKNVIWTSDNTSVAIVDNTGKVTAVSDGTANISVKTEDGNYSASCTVTVAKLEPATQLVEDVNDDGVVDITDLALFAQNYNIKKNDASWNPLFDLNDDHIVDLYDLSKVSKVLGQEISIGNKQGNIVNGGYVAQKEDWIYYYNELDNNKLYKVKTDGTGRMKLSDDSYVCNINVIGGWVYYTNQPGYGDGIFRVRTDGTGRIQLSGENAQYINVIGDWIYYQNVSSLRKMKVDGTEERVLCNNYAQYINVVGDCAYYTDGLDNGKVYKIKTDGAEKTKLSDDNAYYINVVGDWIYYSNYSDGAKIYKIRTDGTEKTKVNDIYSYNINISGDWIYYENGGDLYKMKLDGSYVTAINAKPWSFINVIGDWIYYDNESDGEKLYKMKTDGTGKEILSSEVTGISISPSTLNIIVGDTKKLEFSITPSYAKDKNIKWSSSNTAVANVDSNGTVTAKSQGQAIVTATSEDGSKTAQSTVNVTK